MDWIALLAISYICTIYPFVHGFRQVKELKCNKDSTDNSKTGTFASPNWPSPYPRGKTCTWNIIKPLGTYIKLTISEFDLQGGGKDGCGDYLKVISRSTANPGTKEVTIMCASNTTTPLIVYSSDSDMEVRFVTDWYEPSGKQHAGFRATFEVLSAKCPKAQVTGPNSGTISTPNYPANYPGDKKCFWQIKVPEGFRVHLVFKQFALEGSSGCEYDYVRILDGYNGAPMLAKLCGVRHTPIMYKSTGVAMRVAFKSDLSVGDKGFLLVYNAERAGSPLFPTIQPINDPNRLGGVYRIIPDTTLKGHVIKEMKATSGIACVLCCQRMVNCKAVTVATKASTCWQHSVSSVNAPDS